MNDTKKNLLIILLGALLIFGSIYAATRNVTANDQSTNETIKLGLLSFHTNLSYALESAESENKMIYIYGQSEDCGWCKKFEAESLSDERIIGILNENYILVSVDTVKQKSLALKLGIRGTPHSIFTTSEGQEITGARIPGYMDPEFFYLHLSGIINVTANDQSTNDSYETIKLGLLAFHTNLSDALESAESENKMIYIYGRSEDCGWCKKFEAESLSDERIIGILNENFILLSIDTVKQTSLALTLGIRGTPHSIFTTSEGQEITGARIPGYMDPESFYLHLSGIINNEE